MPIPCIPTLSTTRDEILTKTSDMLAYLVFFFFTNPGAISETFPDLMSFREIEATHETDSEGLIYTIKSTFERVIEHYLPDRSFKVELLRDQGEVNYKLTLSITDGQGVPMMTPQNFIMQDGKLKMAN